MIDEIIIEITYEESGERIDALLSRRVEGLTRTAAQRLCEEGAVLRGTKALKKNHKVTGGEVLSVRIPEVRDTELLAEDIPLEVVYEDLDLIVINKARGMVVHPAPGHESGTMVNALLHRCGAELSGIGGVRRPGIVHRLDKDTSGLIMVAKNDMAHAHLSHQLSERSLSRVYRAVVHGTMPAESGTVDAAIGRHSTDRKRMAVTDKAAREAVTDWSVVERYAMHTHLECRLRTGRTHQIRVHMSHIGHPVVGDLVYGRTKKAEKGLEGQCLHARSLEFTQPTTGERIYLETELPEYFKDVLARLGNVTENVW